MLWMLTVWLLGFLAFSGHAYLRRARARKAWRPAAISLYLLWPLTTVLLLLGWGIGRLTEEPNPNRPERW